MTSNDNTVEVEVLGNFSENLRKSSTIAGEKLTKIVLQIQRRPFEIGAQICSSTGHRNPISNLSTTPGDQMS